MLVPFKKIFLLTSITLCLQSCFFAAGAAAGAAAITIVYDHRTLERTIDDTKLANKIYDHFRSVPALSEESHIEINVFNKVVLLTGETPNPEWQQQAGDIAQSIAPNSKVYNQIVIQGPTSSLTRTSDSWITTKIKTKMLAAENLKSTSIKVVTENGVVYLMGIVKQSQAEIAVDIARQISGVQKVIKIFEYLPN